MRIVALLICPLMLVFCLPGCKRPQAPRAMTRTLIAQVYVGIRSLEKQEGKSLKEMAGMNSLAQTNLNSAIANILLRSGVATKPLGFGSKLGLITDAWGEPLMFVWRESAEGKNLASILRSQSGTIVVWSKGPNRTDENGNGDDITYIEPSDTDSKN